MAWLSELKRSQILQILFLLQLVDLFSFWDSWLGTLCDQPSILIRQREGIVNFRVKMVVQKTVNWRRGVLWYLNITSATAKIAASVAVIWDKKQEEQTSCLLRIANKRANSNSTRTNNPREPTMHERQVFFIFFNQAWQARSDRSRAPGAGRVVFQVGPFLRVVSHLTHHYSILPLNRFPSGA